MQSRPLVYVVILIYNGKQWIDNCLGSVLGSDYPNFRIVALDNNSGDGSSDYIRERFPEVEIIRQQRNVGTAVGNNIGIRHALSKGAEHIITLNQDTKVDPKWIDELVKVVEKDPMIGMLTPEQYDYEQIDKLDPKYESILKGYTTRVDSDYLEANKIIGAGLLTSRAFIEKVGLFDPYYFIYFDENDLRRRGKFFYGYKIGIALKSKIYHWHTLVQEEQRGPRAKRLFDRSQFIFALKNPEGSVLKHLFNYIKNKIFDDVRSKGIYKAIVEFFKWLWIEKGVLLCIPLLWYKRYQEKRRPAYLKCDRII